MFFVLFFSACNQQRAPQDELSSEINPLFIALPTSKTNIDFENTLSLNGNFDVFRYRNYYNGGGVAIGDINNDGLSDIYLTANQGKNRLYLNKGNLQFEDITDKAGVGGTKAWSTGVAMADVNGDGWLDIYVCNSGDVKGDNRGNELFINNHNLTFSEKATDYGLTDGGYSTHAAFFDYDRDGDLDCYVLNNSFRPISTLGFRNLRHIRDQNGGHRLYNNNHGKFEDVSEQAGIYGSVIGFGLGVTVGDVNLDGWQDMYISNDFYERDYLYINQKDGTFKESLTDWMGHISNFSMGADMADLNGDVYPEIFVTDMLPEHLDRIKQTTAFPSYDEYQLTLRNGFHHQYMRNTLQYNNGDGTFSEIAPVVGVHATDWSWGALMVDLDNNGYRDIFVCNGIYKDVTDQDFINFLANDENIKAAQRGEKIDFNKFIDLMPSTKLVNYAFANQGNMQFENKTTAWGFDKPTHSNGAAYGDLDNDGDLELVINNVNDKLLFYENKSNEKQKNNYLKFIIKGTQQNPFAVGSKIIVYSGNNKITYEHTPTRGFESSMDYVPVLGIGQTTRVDSILCLGPYGEVIKFTDTIKINQSYVIDFKNATKSNRDYVIVDNSTKKPFFKPAVKLFSKNQPTHQENLFIDFDRDRLLYSMLSTEGPHLAVGDVNKDGIDDFYLCSAAGSASQLFVFDKRSNAFELTKIQVFEEDQAFEDVSATFADVDNDGDADLYVATGGSEFLSQNELLLDRLYLNESTGGTIRFVRSEGALPRLKRVSSCVLPFDYDKDGDTDFFVGTRMDGKGYGIPTTSFLLENDGKGKFTDVTARRASKLQNLGMVTSAVAEDFNKDSYIDLAIAGDWMPITILYNKKGQFPAAQTVVVPNSSGMWNHITAADFNKDGKLDLLGCNLGLNSRFRGDEKNLMKLYVKDFDNNGSFEQVFCLSDNGKAYPMALKREFGKVLPMINKKFTSFAAYNDKSINEIFGEALLKDTYLQTATNFKTMIFLNQEQQHWQSQDLPMEAQFAPIFSAILEDFDGDGDADMLLGGNFYATKPEIGRYDASYGALLLNDGKAHFSFVPSAKSGIKIRGQIRDLKRITLAKGKEIILVAKNDDVLESFLVNSSKANLK